MLTITKNFLSLILVLSTTTSILQAAPMTLEQMRQEVSVASSTSHTWDGPKTGPKAKYGKTIAIIADDLRNGGILGVAHGVQEAAQALGWRVGVYDSGGTPAGRQQSAHDAFNSNPDGLILNGADAQVMSDLLQPFVDKGIPIVGWHVGPEAGAMDGPVAMNVTTDPIEVAKITAMAAIVAADGKAGVVIFTDSNYEIAMTKANAMADLIRACAQCTLLEVRDVAIADSVHSMPNVTRDLLKKYGERWTHGLAINDIYFDYAVPEFIKAGIPPRQIELLSAGDGSSAAFLRIQSGTFQTTTVAEPLNLHGWQLVDELNRRIENVPVTGYVIPTRLITRKNFTDQGGVGFTYDPDNGYREVYLKIWGH